MGEVMYEVTRLSFVHITKAVRIARACVCVFTCVFTCVVRLTTQLAAVYRAISRRGRMISPSTRREWLSEPLEALRRYIV